MSPTRGWMNNPQINDHTLGDDVERIRHMRNKLSHDDISDTDLTDIMKEVVRICSRFQKVFPEIDCKNAFSRYMESQLYDYHVNMFCLQCKVTCCTCKTECGKKKRLIDYFRDIMGYVDHPLFMHELIFWFAMIGQLIQLTKKDFLEIVRFTIFQCFNYVLLTFIQKKFYIFQRKYIIKLTFLLPWLRNMFVLEKGIFFAGCILLVTIIIIYACITKRKTTSMVKLSSNTDEWDFMSLICLIVALFYVLANGSLREFSIHDTKNEDFYALYEHRKNMTVKYLMNYIFPVWLTDTILSNS